MEKIFDAMLDFFTKDDWPFTQLEDRPILRMGFQGNNGSWVCFAQAKEEPQQFLFYSVCAFSVPVEKRLAMAEFLTRANYGMVIGNFELDFNDGEVRYKTSVGVEGDRLSFAVIKQLVYANVFTLDRYLPGIMQVIYTDVTPAAAVEQIEG